MVYHIYVLGYIQFILLWDIPLSSYCISPLSSCRISLLSSCEIAFYSSIGYNLYPIGYHLCPPIVYHLYPSMRYHLYPPLGYQLYPPMRYHLYPAVGYHSCGCMISDPGYIWSGDIYDSSRYRLVSTTPLIYFNLETLCPGKNQFLFQKFLN